MAPTWMAPRQTAHSVEPAPLPLCLTSRLYMKAGSPAAAALSGRSSSSEPSPPAAAAAASARATSPSSAEGWARRCARCLYSETRAKAAVQRDEGEGGGRRRRDGAEEEEEAVR